MVVIVSILALLFFLSTGLFAFVAWRYGQMLMNVEDNTQYALDLLNRRYHQMTHLIGDSKLLSDDEVVRKFIKEVKATRNDVLVVAQTLMQSTAIFQDSIGGEIEAPALENQTEEKTVVNTTRGQEEKED